ncbi:hypothetical protein FKP32DRAFT_1681985 [Trametes sanguinea]|nr:hypothetical protein FKP32DRAFT_1681985 [Trametes sanguinea]
MEAGFTVTNQDKILAIMMGLPAAYDPVIISFNATPTEQLILHVVISRLLNEEVPKATKITCFFCDKTGHYKSYCPERTAWEASKTGGGRANTAIAPVPYDYSAVGELQEVAW